MKLTLTVPSKMPDLSEGDIIALDRTPYRILSKTIVRDPDGILITDVIIQLLALEVTQVKITQVSIKTLEDLFYAGRLESGVDSNTYTIPHLEPGDEAILKTRYKLFKDYIDSLYPDFRILQTRGIQKDDFQRLTRLCMLSTRQTRRLLLRFLQSGQSLFSLVDGRQTRIQRGYDPRAGAVRGRKKNEKSNVVLNDKELEDNFEAAFRHLQLLLNEKRFHMKSKNRPTARSIHTWMIYEYYYYRNEKGTKVPLPDDQCPSYERFSRWLRREKFGNGRIRDHMVSKMDWNNNRRLLVGDECYGVHHPGELVFIDETEVSFDLVTADPSREGQCIGGAIVHLAVDAATRAIVGITATIQVNNSYEGVINIFEIMLLDDSEKKIALLGNHYNPDDERVFPDALIPEHIQVDRGAEYTSKAIVENLTGGSSYYQLEGIPTDITLARSGTGSDKGTVERVFGTINRNLADATGYGHGYRADAHGSKHRLQAHVDILKFRRFLYEIVKDHNNSPLTSYPVSPEILDNVPGMTPLQLWDYLNRHYGSGIVPDKRNRNVYRYAIMVKKTLRISRKQISYKDFLYWDVSECKELLNLSLLNKDKGENIDVKIDPRTVSRIYYKDSKGDIYVLPLARKRSNMAAFAQWTWSVFDKWYDEVYHPADKENKDKKTRGQQILYNTLTSMVNSSVSGENILSTSTKTDAIRGAGAVERLALTAYDRQIGDQLFGNNGFIVPAEEITADDVSGLPHNKEVLPISENDDTNETDSYENYLGLDLDDDGEDD